MPLPTNREDGLYMPVWKSVEYPRFPTLNVTTSASRLIEKASFCLDDLREEEFYDGQKNICVTIEVDITPIVVKNHNGYSIMWVTEESQRQGVISLEEYILWDKTHKAKWIDNTWCYEPI